MKGRRWSILGMAALAAMLLSWGAVVQAADQWPSKPITLIVGFGAGGGTDVIARTLTKDMGQYLKQSSMTINMAGGSGAVAGMEVVKKPADGYTWFGCANNTGRWATLGYTDLTFSDFYGFFAATDAQGIVVHADSPWKTIEELVAEIKAKPKKLRYGVSGQGASGHIAGELFLSALGLPGQAVAVPYSGAREAGVKLLAKEIEFYVSGIADIADFVDTGKMVVLGVFDDQPMQIGGAKPHIAPSLVKKYPASVKAVPMNAIWGIQIPRATPDPIVDRMAEAFVHSVKSKSFKEFAKTRGLDIFPHIGLASDQVSSRVESAYAWGFQEVGMAKKSPESLGIPKPDAWKWPPHEKAAKAKPWPARWQDWKPYLEKP